LQTLFLAVLILAPTGPVGERFAGLMQFPPDFRGALCLLLLGNLAAAWLTDAFASWAYSRLKGRRLGRYTIS
jgi:hypothetical protein